MVGLGNKEKQKGNGLNSWWVDLLIFSLNLFQNKYIKH